MLITFQAMINMAVAVNLIPVTGQPLPIISWGGSSMLSTCVSLGNHPEREPGYKGTERIEY